MQTEKKIGTVGPLVTVVIPTYNHERYISQAIESVVFQTYKNLELIVIDDGSRDHSLSIINDLADRYGFIFIARENRGLAKTLNEGIQLAKGKYICFLASDDYYYPLRVENAVLQLEKTSDKVAIVYCDGHIVNEENQLIGLFSDKFARPLIGSIYNNLLVGNWLPALGVTYKTEVLKQFMFDERFKIEDHTLFLRMFKNNQYKLIFYNEIGFAYRWHANNTSKPSELMNIENKLIQYHFHEAGNYAEFKEKLKSHKFSKIDVTQWKNFYLLYLQFIRTFQLTLNFNHKVHISSWKDRIK